MFNISMPLTCGAFFVPLRRFSPAFDRTSVQRIILFVIITIMMMTSVCYADTAMAPISVKPLWDTVIPYASAIATAFCTALTLLANSWLAAHKASIAQDDVDQALQHAPGLMTQFLAGLSAHNETLSVPAGIASVAQSLIAMVPAQANTLGITTAEMQQYVAGKLAAVGHAAVAPLTEQPAAPNPKTNS